MEKEDRNYYLGLRLFGLVLCCLAVSAEARDVEQTVLDLERPPRCWTSFASCAKDAGVNAAGRRATSHSEHMLTEIIFSCRSHVTDLFRFLLSGPRGIVSDDKSA